MANHYSPFPLVAHPYRSPTRASCAYETGNTSSKNAIVFIAGLRDGPHTVPYIRSVSDRLEKETALSYSVFEIRMRSSFDGFGFTSLEDDVHDISALVKYLRSMGKEKVILFGHSTGCQDCMEYTQYEKHVSSPVDGFILQGPISDRESLDIYLPDHQQYLDYADEMIADGRGDHCMPKDKRPSALCEVITANRLHSLFAKGGGDDYFSSDLDDETVKKFWSQFRRPVLILHSEDDEFVPPHVDQQALNDKWRQVNTTWVSPLSGLIPDAGHTVRGADAQEWLAERVVQFLTSL